MGRKRARRLLSLLVALSSALVVAVPVRADQPPDHHGRVTVENVWVTPANEAGQAILRLRILNDTHSPMHLLGVATPLAKTPKLSGESATARQRALARSASGRMARLTSRQVDRKSTRLNSSH